MKKYLFSLIPFVLLGVQPDVPGHARSLTDDPGLQPTVTQRKVQEVVTGILTKYHYRPVELNDSLSSKIWDNYLKEIDNSKAYLLADDVKSLEKYRYEMDEALPAGNLLPAYEVYNLYMKRFRERMAHVTRLLDDKKSYDFTADESYETDRDKTSWAKNSDELDDLWRKMLKSQALELKLAGKADTAAVKLLKERYNNLDRYYTKLTSDYVFQMFMNSFAECIDPHTSYMAPPDATRFKDEMAQSFEGIGASLVQEGDYTKIRELIPGGPAIKSNLLHIDDRIVGVGQGESGNVVSVTGWNLDEVVKLIRGPKGSTVRLSILPVESPVGAPPKEIKLTRDKIKLEEGVAKREVVPFTYEGKEYKLGLITIPGFYQDFDGMRRGNRDANSTSKDVRGFLEEFKKEGITGVVIDLRNNGGGSLDEAIKLSGLFIKNGPVVQVKDASGKIDVDSDPDPSQVYAGPLAVLVNRFSASASEIFAGAIQDYKRGLVIGEQTYGKGTVQQLLDLNQALPKEGEKVGLLKMTRAKFYRITGSSTQHRGVTPDIELPSRFTAEEFGESSQPSALPWDQIVASRFDLYPDVTAQNLQKIKNQYQERLKTDPELKQLVTDVEDFKKMKDKTVVSLNEAKRRAELDELKKKAELAKTTKQAAQKTSSIQFRGGGGTAGQDVASAGSTRVSGSTAERPEVATAQAGTPNIASKMERDTQLKETTRILADWIALKK
jgi:carboxyl-terminal processing protease